jgi:hypothetical protein
MAQVLSFCPILKPDLFIQSSTGLPGTYGYGARGPLLAARDLPRSGAMLTIFAAILALGNCSRLGYHPAGMEKLKVGVITAAARHIVQQTSEAFIEKSD